MQNSIQSRRVLIAPNSFKECSNSVTISNLICNHLAKKLDNNLIRKPISDGGDGFTEVCKYYFDGEELTYKISTPYNDEPMDCKVIYDSETKTVYIESANVLGLKVVPTEKRNPLLLSSKGLGELLLRLSVEKIDIQKVVIGIGGTATIDMGLGVCSTLGLQLIDGDGKDLDAVPCNFHKVLDIVWEKNKLPFSLLSIIDVSNPLLGTKGAARQFGPQKGADKSSIELIENGFTNILNLLKNKELIHSSKVQYGAGGGITAGINLFLGGEEISGEKFIIEDLKLEDQIMMSDIIITGEGAFDQQSFMGKGAGIVLNKAVEYGKEVILICGKIDENIRTKLNDHVKVFQISSLFKSEEESIKNFETGLKIICDRIVPTMK
jgi:glycerate kinase